MGETCGAVTGAIMIIGLFQGKTRPDDKEADQETNKTARAFIEVFRSRNYSTLCRELLGCDVGTPEGMEFAKKHNLKDRLCSRFVKDAAEIIEELIFL
jgi:C_GCAxxG_C_C family probable redox protein